MNQNTTNSRYSFLCCVFCFLFAMWPTGRCIAQVKTVTKPGTDTALIKRLIDDAKKASNPDSGISLCERAIQLSDKGDYSKGSFLAWHVIAKKQLEKSDFPKALFAFQQEMSFTLTKYSRAACYVNMGYVDIMRADYVTASNYCYAGLRELGNDTTARGRDVYISIYNELAVVNQNLKQDTKWLYYLNEEEKIIRKYNMTDRLATLLINKYSYYHEQGQFDSQLHYLHAADTVCIKTNDPEGKICTDQMLGNLYNDSGKYEIGLSYFQAALKELNENHTYKYDFYHTVLSYSIGGNLYRLHRYKEAEAVILPILKKARLTNEKHNFVDAYATLADIYKETGRYKEAANYKDTLIAIKDSLSGAEKAKAINQMEIKYQTAEKDKLLSQNQLVIAQQNIKIARKNVWMLSAASSTLLLLLLSAGIYLLARNKQKSLDRENKIAVLKAAVAGGDNERSRIARELHDGIGGMLSAAMMRFSSIHHEHALITETNAYKEVMGILNEMGDEIRKTAHNLMPDVLLKQTLPEAVRVYCSSVHDNNSLKIDFQSYGSFEDLTQGQKLNLYRIVQELIKNVIRHAKASHVLVQLLRNEDKLIVSVEDNGTGFNAANISDGLGLNNIRTRVDILDGYFSMESLPGKGTTVIVEIEMPRIPGIEPVINKGE